MGLLFGSAGAHTYLKSGQVAPPPPRKRYIRQLLKPSLEHDCKHILPLLRLYGDQA